MRKRLSIVILALFILGICTGVASAKDNGKSDTKSNGNKSKVTVKTSIKNANHKFKDMQNEWSREAVMEAAVLGFVNGDDKGNFNPNKPLTNLEAVVMLLNAEGVDMEDYSLDEDTEEFFADEKLLKKIPDWGKKYLQIAYEEGMIQENELKNFNPNQGIKRYEVCLYLARITEDTDSIPQSKQEFKDWQEIPEQYREIVQNMRNLGLVNGDLNGKFSPNRVVKRCEMAVMLSSLEDNALNRFSDYKVRGSLELILTPDVDGNYTLIVNTGSKEVNVEADEDTVVFVDGVEVENLEDLDDIEEGSRVKIIIKDDKAVLVRITTVDEDDEDYKVTGAFEAVSDPDEDGDYTITVDTDDEGLVKVDADEDTEVFIDRVEINDLDDLDDIDKGAEVKITVDDGKAIVVTITSEED